MGEVVFQPVCARDYDNFFFTCLSLSKNKINMMNYIDHTLTLRNLKTVFSMKKY